MLREIKWAAKESGEDFLKGRFSRAHTVSFDGGTEVPASASPHVVGKWAVESAVDPEEMLVASLSSCHMLSFLHLARMAGFTVTAYEDHAEGTTEEIAPGRLAVTKVKLRPKIEWAGAAPEQGGARSPAPRGPRNLLHREFGEDGSHRGVGRSSVSEYGGRASDQDTPNEAATRTRSRGGSPSTPCRCYCRACCPPAGSCDRAPSAPTLEERPAVARFRRSTSGSPYPEVAPASAC